MNIEKELRDALLRLPAVTDIVESRVWDEWFRTEKVPAIVFEFDSEDENNALDGRSDLILADVNIICRADSRKKSRELSEAVRTNDTSPASGLAGWYGGQEGQVLQDAAGNDLLDGHGNRIYVGGADGVTRTFKAWLEGRQTAAVPKTEAGNDYWNDTNMSFRLQWLEEMH